MRNDDKLALTIINDDSAIEETAKGIDNDNDNDNASKTTNR